MKYEMMPVIDIWDLHKAIVLQYGQEFANEYGGNAHGLCGFLFGDDYMNDCYKSHYLEIEEFDPVNKPWQNEQHIRLMNCINQYLLDVLPEGTQRVLIDVSW